jgi:hypothetical protein
VAHFNQSGSRHSDTQWCAQCEAMLADALDNTLSETDQALFEAHAAICGPCSHMLADARRGAAWLEMLRSPRPEPSPMLLERILSLTSGIEAGSAQYPPAVIPAPLPAPGAAAFGAAKVLPFRRRIAVGLRYGAPGRIVLEPRLAMTAAMAFFSIALTMNLTGVRLGDLRPGDLQPATIRRDFYAANASVVRYYEGLRVVYELESRVHDLEDSGADESPSQSPDGPDSPGQSEPGQSEPPAPGHPAAPAGSPDNAPPEQRRPAVRQAPNSGTSRREGDGRSQSVALLTPHKSRTQSTPRAPEGKTV